MPLYDVNETGSGSSYAVGGLTPFDGVIDVTGGTPGPYFAALEYWTEIGDPLSSEGFQALMEWEDDGGIMQSIGGVPIPVSVDRSAGARQSFPLQLVKRASGTSIWTVTFSKSSINPYGVGLSKIGFRIATTRAQWPSTPFNGDGDIQFYPTAPQFP